MKSKVLAVILVVVGILIFLLSWDNFVDLYNTFRQPPEFDPETYYAIIGQGLFYFIFFAMTILFGLLMMLELKGRKLNIARVTFFVLLTIWCVLEIPVYKCDYYNISHSFWKSKRGHFH